MKTGRKGKKKSIKTLKNLENKKIQVKYELSITKKKSKITAGGSQSHHYTKNPGQTIFY